MNTNITAGTIAYIAPDGAACVWDPDTYPNYWQKVGGAGGEG